MKEIITDFVRNDGTYMVINSKKGLHPEQLNVVQRNMLNAVAIPHLLRLEVREIDFNVTLHYEITGKRMLSQCLRSDWITMTEFYSLLLQIVKVLDHSKEYMLFSANYLLGEDHIFVDNPLPSGTVYLTYLPVLQMPSERSLPQSMMDLVNRLMTRVTDMEGNGIQKIISLCGGELFSVARLKDLLTSLLIDDDPGREQEATIHSIGSGKRREVADPELQLPLNSSNGLHVPLTAREASPSLVLSRITALSDSRDPADALTKVEEDELQEGAGSRSEIKSTYIWLGAALLVALIWKFAYMDKPSDRGLYISTGISLAVLLIALLMKRGNFHLGHFFRREDDGEEKLQKVDTGEEEQEEFKVTKRRRLERYEEKWRWSDPTPSKTPSSRRSSDSHGSSQIPVSKLFRELAEMPPAPVAAFPATVLLKDLSKSEQGQSGSGHYLERITSSGAGPERIPLSQGSFIIGRSEELAQYVEKEAGVSRAHVELMILEGSCRIKDLGSRNGTKLNGELLAPYKDYPLEPGDSFTIAESTFRYGPGNSKIGITQGEKRG